VIRGNVIVYILQRILCNDPKAREIVIRSRNGSIKVRKLLNYIKRNYYPVYRALLRVSPREDETSLAHAIRASLRHIKIYQKEYICLGDICAELQIHQKTNKIA